MEFPYSVSFWGTSIHTVIKKLLCLPIWCLAACLAGCGGSSVVKPAPAAKTGMAGSPEQDPQYVIGPGDLLKVVVLRSPELSQEVPVRPDGKISTPMVDDMVAVGKTSSQLARDIEGALKDFVRAPTVSVIVSRANSVFSQIKVVGQGVAPKTLPYRAGMRVLDVIIEAGGLSQFASGNRAKIVRTENGKSSQIKVRLKDLMDGGDISQNVLMMPGDVLVVPEARF